jgi:hypothetical protein
MNHIIQGLFAALLCYSAAVFSFSPVGYVMGNLVRHRFSASEAWEHARSEAQRRCFIAGRWGATPVAIGVGIQVATGARLLFWSIGVGAAIGLLIWHHMTKRALDAEFAGQPK